jgi:xanthine dehydrogenase YagT iron-sulfur-binding subunit
MGKESKVQDLNRATDLSRRTFLSAASAGLVGAAIVPDLQAKPRELPSQAENHELRVELLINDTKHNVRVEPRMSLLFVLRDQIGLTGTRVGCERGECGACTVIIDGKARYACLTLPAEVEGKAITTIEGLASDLGLNSVQQAFVDKDAFQCGYCTSGQIMAAEAFLRQHSDPSLEQIREAMSGNLCRCGAYKHIVEAVRQAAMTGRERK